MELSDAQITEIKNMLDIHGIIDLIRQGTFKPITKPLSKDFYKKTTCQCCGSILADNGKELYEAAMKNYRLSVAAKHEAFRYACCYEVGLEIGEVKTIKAFTMAWSRGHSAGLHEVYYELQELAELLK